MEPAVETVAACIVVLAVVAITRYAKRVRKDFHISSVVKFDDLRVGPRLTASQQGSSISRKSGIRGL